jgi:hypothetical protein
MERRCPVASRQPMRISANDAAIVTVKGSDSTTTPAATATAGLMYVKTMAREVPTSRMS